MRIDYPLLKQIADEYGESFYLLDSKQFTQNYLELQAAFRKYYPQSYIAYSYKTNYTPKLCKIINELGGYAEVVSDMEVEIARRISVPAEKIIFNGPYKNMSAVKKLLLDGGCVNVDSIEELQEIASWAKSYPNHTFNIGVRCNFQINDGVVSRFGIDTTSEIFAQVMSLISKTENLHLAEMHCHFAARSLETWPERTAGMLDLVKSQEQMPDNIDLGGGLFGKIGDSLKAQFDTYIPNYEEYAQAAAKLVADTFAMCEEKPKLMIEPGSGLVGDSMRFAAKVVGLKDIRGKSIATLLGSIYNINPTLNKKNPPITVYHKDENADLAYFKDLDFGGFTCIESDYLYRHYDGKLAIGDYVVFENVGSYSVVLKPPFILPNFAIVDCSWDNGQIELIKQPETFDDLFHTFEF